MLRDHDKDREPISIHALREEGDENCAVLRCPTHRFYPRPPRGGRRLVRKNGHFAEKYFYPRPPRGGRPRRRESSRATKGDFYPRPPRGGRRDGKMCNFKRA